MGKLTKKKKTMIVIVTVVLTAAVAGGFWYWKSKQTKSNNKKSNNQASQNAPDKKNTTEVPTPVLVKSIGSAGSVPKGTNVDFTCFGPPGYACQLSLKPQSGTAPSFDKKNFNSDSRGQSFANWQWKATVGSWEAQVTMFNSGGQSKASETQNFEVK